MSTPEPPGGRGGVGGPPAAPDQPVPWMPPNARNTPNAEKYLLEADALRRRQLRSALLHGSSRTWREQKRIWPAVVAGIVLVAVILATFKVVQAVKEDNPATLTPQSVAPSVPLTSVPLTTAPSTTAPLTTAPLTTAPLTTAPLTTRSPRTAPRSSAGRR